MDVGERSPRGRLRRWRARGGALLLGLVVAAVTGEVAARLVLDDTRVFGRIDRWERHPRLGRVLKPDFSYAAAGAEYHINELRLRGRSVAPVPAPGTYRIAIVGDSFVFGVGPEEKTFARVLGARLRERLGDRVEVFPVGLPGYGTVQENDFLEALLPAHRFDLLVHALCVGNDLRENRRSIEWARDPNALARHFRQPSLWRRLSSRSRLVSVLRQVLGTGRGDAEQRFHGHVRRRVALALPSTYDDPTWQAAWDRTLVEIERMRDIATGRGAGFAVVLLPDEYQVDADLRVRAARDDGISPTDLVADLVQRRLGPALQERAIETLDPLPRFLDAPQPGRLFVPLDTHYDEEGNRLVASALEEWIAAEHGAAIVRRTHED